MKITSRQMEEKKMIITTGWLKGKNACSEGIAWFSAQSKTDSLLVLEKLIAENKLQWANWLIVRVMDYRQYVSYAVYAAEQVIDIWESKYPNDNNPRFAIEAAKKCIAEPSAENKKAARDAAAYAADAAAADATDKMMLKILQHGIELLREGK